MSGHIAQKGLRSGCGVGSFQGGALGSCEDLRCHALGIEILQIIGKIRHLEKITGTILRQCLWVTTRTDNMKSHITIISTK